jgi:hypothetical protein
MPLVTFVTILVQIVRLEARGGGCLDGAKQGLSSRLRCQHYDYASGKITNLISHDSVGVDGLNRSFTIIQHDQMQPLMIDSFFIQQFRV